MTHLSEEESFLKNCWNSSIQPELFLEQLTNFAEEQIRIIICSLFRFCCFSPPQLFINYLLALMNEKSYDILSFVDINDEKHLLGCSQVLFLKGDSMFNLLPIGTHESAHMILSAIWIALHCPNSELMERALIKLSQSHIVCIILASARVHDPEFFIQVRLFWQKVNSLLHERKIFSSKSAIHSNECASLFLSALFKDSFDPHERFGLGEYFLISLSTIFNWHIHPPVFFLFFQELPLILYAHSINLFQSKPSLLNGYLISYLLVKIILNKPLEEHPVFNSNEIEQVLDLIYSNPFLVNSDLRNPNDIPQFIPLEDAKQFLTSVPPSPSISSLFTDFLQYPALSISFPFRIIEIIKTESIPIVEKVIEGTYSILNDFLTLINQIGILNQLLDALLSRANEVNNDSHFDKLWVGYCSYLRLSWLTGSYTIRKSLLKYIYSKECLPLRRFLAYLIHLNPKQTYKILSHSNINPIKNNNLNNNLNNNNLNNDEILDDFFNDKISDDEISDNENFDDEILNENFGNQEGKITYEEFLKESCPYQKNLKYIDLLNNDCSPRCFALVENSPSLYLSALLWGINSKRREASELLNKKVPNYEIHNMLFFFMTLGLTSPLLPWNGALIHPDCDMIIRFRPPSIETIQSFLLNDLMLLEKSPTFDQTLINNLIISWRSWILIFGIDVLVETLLGLLCQSTNRAFMDLSKNIFRSAAYLIVVICDGNKKMTIKALKAAERIVENSNSDYIDEVVARFCQTLLLTFFDDYEALFQEMFEFGLAEVNKNDHIGFLYHFVKNSLFVTTLQKLIPESIIPIFLKRNSWNTIVDFYITKGKEILDPYIQNNNQKDSNV